MADPEAWLAEKIQAAMFAAFGDTISATDPAVRRSDRADYQANAALGLAKSLRRPPREVAQAIIDRLELGAACERLEVSGPGFINITLSNDYLQQELNRALEAARRGDKSDAVDAQTIVIDYSAPNVAKEMHVGHLRATIIGDALGRVFEFLGHRVIRQNHIGDWGTPFGMLIEHLLDVDEQQVLSISEPNVFYQQARQKFDSDPDFAERARRRVVALQSGDARTLELWQLLIGQSKKHFALIYERMGVTLTEQDIRGESFYNPMLADVAAELEQKAIARIDDGALCVFPEGFTGRDGNPLPVIVRKKDGGYGYAATDLAAVRYRAQTLHADRLIYVVGGEQQQHFAMVFATARLAGWLSDKVRAEHVWFGLILGPDKKRFKTRSGESVKLSGLLDEALARADQIVRDKNPNLDEATRSQVTRQVGIGALKYADLSNDRIKDYVFDWDRMLSFDGNTAPYLQYAHARSGSILRKAEAHRPTDPPAILIKDPVERALGLELLHFSGVVAEVADSLQPHRLCGYLYDLATLFMTFFERCPVLRAESEELRASRLQLCESTESVLRQGLELLGIEAPERM